jgi:hypothetical protein
MTNSCILVKFIDKNNYNAINNLHKNHDDFFSIGRTNWIDDKVTILGIEPEIKRKKTREIDFHSIWIGWDIDPQDNFLDNFKLFENFRDWVEESLYILRFLVNWNLKAQIYFYAEWDATKNISRCSIQEEIDLYCKSGSNFHVSFNKVNFFFPLLKKLLKFQPTENFKSIFYNYALSKRGNSAIIDYFYEFAVLDGFISNWATNSGYSELWGKGIANAKEQQSLHESLRKNFQEFYKMIKKSEGITEEKLGQLNSLIDINFPNERRIRRSLSQRLKSYIEIRLPENIRDNEMIKLLSHDFRKISDRRHIIGHSLGDYTKLESFAKYSEILFSSLKLIMDFEIEKFIDREIDWKFEERANDIANIFRPKTKEKILEKFIHSSTTDFPIKNYIQSKDMIWNLKKCEFFHHFSLKNREKEDSGEEESEEEDSLTTKERYFKIYFFENPENTENHSMPKNSNLIDINDNPECLIYSSYGIITHIFKITNFPNEINNVFTKNSTEISADIDPSIFRTIIKLENIKLPPDFDFYNLLCSHQ